MTPLNISFFSKVNVELGYNLKFTQCHRAATAVVNYRLSLAESRVKKCTKLSQNLLSFLLFSPLSLMSRRFSGLFFAQNRKFHNMHMKVGSLCQNIFCALHSPKGWKRMRKCSIKFEVAWKEKHKYFEREPWMQHTAMKLCKWTFHWFSIFLSFAVCFCCCIHRYVKTMMMISNCQWILQRVQHGRVSDMLKGIHSSFYW